jgi:hypothetical protein
VVCRTDAVLRSTVLTLGLLGSALALAQGSDPAPEGPATEPPALVEQGPSLELLEFLGQWETDDGEWIAPEDLADAEFGLLLDASLEIEPDESD